MVEVRENLGSDHTTVMFVVMTVFICTPVNRKKRICIKHHAFSDGGTRVAVSFLPPSPNAPNHLPNFPISNANKKINRKSGNCTTEATTLIQQFIKKKKTLDMYDTCYRESGITGFCKFRVHYWVLQGGGFFYPVMPQEILDYDNRKPGWTW